MRKRADSTKTTVWQYIEIFPMLAEACYVSCINLLRICCTSNNFVGSYFLVSCSCSILSSFFAVFVTFMIRNLYIFADLVVLRKPPTVLPYIFALRLLF